MNLLKQIVPEEILSKGVPPMPEGSNEIAWPLDIAKKVLEVAQKSGCAILGGDIYTKNEKRFVPTHDNWYSDIAKGEKWESFVDRSHLEASNYLNNQWLDEQSWVVLVVANKPTAVQISKSHAR